MSLQPTFQAARPSQYSCSESIPGIGTLTSTILTSTFIDGLGVFGLAANGRCPRQLAGTTPLQRENKLSVGNEPAQ